MSAPRRRIMLIGLLLTGLVGAGSAPVRQGHADALRGRLAYGEERSQDAVARLRAELLAGERRLEWNERRGWLPALLECWKVPVSSQVLVFSKTSFQPERISPRSPRALYYSDEVFIGWIPGAPVMEITTIDPRHGPTFYTLAQRAGQPVFERRDGECLQCHESSRTRDWPGNLVRSVRPDEEGNPVYRAGTYLTTDASPLVERWGGWYVTGTHGEQRHMGNALLRAGHEDEPLELESGANLLDLSTRFETEAYPSAHSDIVALMVMEHQATMLNVLARASYEGRLAVDYQRSLNEALGKPADALPESLRSRFEALAAEVVDHLLMREEAKLRSPIVGSSSFARDFAARGPSDSRGRSLRELHLVRRLFKYRCSYLIYSPAFDQLPAPVLEAVWRQLGDVLAGREVGRDFSDLTSNARRAILGILRETKPGLPESWSQLTVR